MPSRSMCLDCRGELRRMGSGRFNDRRCESCLYAWRVKHWGQARADEAKRQGEAMRAVWARRKAREPFRTDDEKRFREAVTRLTKLAITCGFLPSIDGQACADCGKPAECYDHRDYSQPLLVAAVCLQCNASRRKGLMPAALYLPKQGKAA